jgi:hypothetical protein
MSEAKHGMERSYMTAEHKRESKGGPKQEVLKKRATISQGHPFSPKAELHIMEQSST